MRDPVSREANGDGVSGAVSEAAGRLHQAVSRLEASLAERPTSPAAATQDAGVEQDRLSVELKVAQDRERVLEAAAAAASEALGRAAAEVRAALQDGEFDSPEKESDAKIMGDEEAA